MLVQPFFCLMRLSQPLKHMSMSREKVQRLRWSEFAYKGAMRCKAQR